MKEINLIKTLFIILFIAIVFFGGGIIFLEIRPSNDFRKCYSFKDIGTAFTVFNACNGQLWVATEKTGGFRQIKFHTDAEFLKKPSAEEFLNDVKEP